MVAVEVRVGAVVVAARAQVEAAAPELEAVGGDDVVRRVAVGAQRRLVESSSKTRGRRGTILRTSRTGRRGSCGRRRAWPSGATPRSARGSAGPSRSRCGRRCSRAGRAARPRSAAVSTASGLDSPSTVTVPGFSALWQAAHSCAFCDSAAAPGNGRRGADGEGERRRGADEPERPRSPGVARYVVLARHLSGSLRDRRRTSTAGGRSGTSPRRRRDRAVGLRASPRGGSRGGTVRRRCLRRGSPDSRCGPARRPSCECIARCRRSGRRSAARGTRRRTPRGRDGSAGRRCRR